MADVFISYKREERAQVERIAERLRGLGLSVWFDARLPSGESFDEEINRELHAAKCVLVCWSPGAVQSQWVRAEAAIGRDRDVLAAVTLAPTSLYPPFNLIHSIDLANWDGADLHPGWLAVIGRIGALADRRDLVERAGRYAAVSAATDDDPVKRVTIEKRGAKQEGKRGWGFWAAIAAAVVVLAVSGLWTFQRLQASREQTVMYDVVFEGDLLRVRAGMPVFFNGIEVGAVASVQINAADSSQVVARLNISPDVPVRVDSEATLETVGALLGVNISPGSQDGELLGYVAGQPPPRIHQTLRVDAGAPAPLSLPRGPGFRALTDGAFFDLDGVEATNGGDVFLAFPFLRVERPGVVVAVANAALPSLADCQQALRSHGLQSTVSLLLSEVGDTACITTDQNHVATLQVNQVAEDSRQIQIRYFVWSEGR